MKEKDGKAKRRGKSCAFYLDEAEQELLQVIESTGRKKSWAIREGLKRICQEIIPAEYSRIVGE